MTDIALPAGVKPLDLEYPKYDDADKRDYTVGDHGELTMYYTNRFGWCIATLGISNSRRGMPARTYGIAVKTKQAVSMGNGPHVLKQIRLYVRQSRVADLKPYTDLYNEGMIKAGEIRDSRSSKIAATRARRNAFYSSWDR